MPTALPIIGGQTVEVAEVVHLPVKILNVNRNLPNGQSTVDLETYYENGGVRITFLDVNTLYLLKSR